MARIPLRKQRNEIIGVWGQRPDSRAAKEEPVSWIPVIVLPNIEIQVPFSGRYATIVRYHDRRLGALRREFPKLRRFLNGFRDAFGRIHRPSVLMLHEDKYDTYRQSEAIAAFRDVLALSVVPYARAWRLQHRTTSFGPLYANAFSFYPWMMDRYNDGLIASTPAMLATDETTKFSGRISPEIGYYPVTEIDQPLMHTLIERWEVRFDTPNAAWRDRALFRSLNTAFYASQTPFHTAGTPYDSGRLVAGWVSAFEVLAHGGPGTSSNMTAVLKILCGPKAKSATTRKTIYSRLNQARSNFLHGDDVSAHQPDRLMHYGSVLYRLMLTEFLGLHREFADIPGRRNKAWAQKFGKEAFLQRDFESYQDRYEKAIDTYLKPPRDLRATHRRVTRRNDRS